jgi:hypothetical protein
VLSYIKRAADTVSAKPDGPCLVTMATNADAVTAAAPALALAHAPAAMGTLFVSAGGSLTSESVGFVSSC